MIETILTSLGVFLALCEILYGFIYIGYHPGWLGAFWGILLIVNGSTALFFFLSCLADRHDEDYNDDDHDPY